MSVFPPPPAVAARRFVVWRGEVNAERHWFPKDIYIFMGVPLPLLALRLIREASGIDKRKRTAVYHDFDSLAGTWCAEDEAAFSSATQGLEAVDEDLWK